MLATKISQIFQKASLRGELFRGGIASVGLKILAMLLSFGMAVLLARTLGPEGYGIYAFAMAVVTIFAIPAQAGLPIVVVRETAKAHVEESWSLMRGLWRWANKVTLGLSLIVIVLFLIYMLIEDSYEHEKRITLWIGFFLLPILALGHIRGAALRGLRKVIIGQAPETVIRPAFFIAFLAMFFVGYDISPAPSLAMSMHLAAAVVAFLIGSFLLSHYEPSQIKSSSKIELEPKIWRSSLLPLSFVAGANVINAQADILMLGWLRSDSEVGLYKVVISAVVAINFGRQAITAVVTPYFAKYVYEKNIRQLQGLVTRSARAMMVLAFPVYMLFLFFGDVFLTTLFGEPYSEGYTSLVIVSSGILIAVALGSVAALLNMSSNEKFTAYGAVFSAVVNLTLNLLLIPNWGIEGAALAYAISMVLYSLFLWFAVRVKVGVNSGIFTTLKYR